MERIRAFFNEHDKYAKYSGMEITEVSEGKAKARMEIKEHHLNGVNTVQGGAIFTLADLAFAAAANSYGTVAVAINVSISFVKAVSSGTLYAEAHETSRNPKLGTYEVTVTDYNDDLVATFHGMVYRKKDNLPV